MTRDQPIFVFADWTELEQPTLIGQLHRALVRGEEVLSFEYDAEWLSRSQPFLLDPRLQFVGGRQYADASNSFGLFLDSAPDRWGRLLIRRRAALESNNRSPILFDSDYLLAVSDTCRMGALRFREGLDGPFLAEDSELSVPPLQSLRKLEQASRRFEAADTDDPEHIKWLQMLIAPGTSLGGARPKCSVIDPEGQLWIAKFPSRADEYDVGAWEGLVHELAKAAGLQIAPSRTERFSRSGHTFLTRRFDRLKKQRIHFASAMNLLGYKDGDGAKTGASYLDLVELIERYGANASKDLEELWRRIVFNICINNTDDHLRNHGFLLSEQGWRLSPAYDLNAQPWRTGLALNIDENSNACDVDLAREVGKYFRLSTKQQEQIIKQVSSAVKFWQKHAEAAGFQRSEIEHMRVALEQPD
ncbi:MAG: type II toxin-antitoxin system HipA family toxin [Opitutales bacterium]|nr:type II toxin-antitoxin system HipA family toxin [Opitutales bacterium]